MMKLLGSSWLAIGALAAAGLANAGTPKPADNWVGSWATSVHAADPGTEMSDVTIRETVHVSLGGQRLRLRFSNEFGHVPLRIGEVAVALAGKGITTPGPGFAAVQPGTARPLLFQGKRNTLIAQGATLTSDALDFDLPAQADLVISIYLPSQPMIGVTWHGAARWTNAVAPGDHVNDISLPQAQAKTSSYFLSAVEVMGDAGSHAVITLGDSITDGYGIETNSNRRWPDLLAGRFVAAGADTGVLNLAIGGGRLLNEHNGPAGVGRLQREGFALPGVSDVIVAIGINDIGYQGLPHQRSDEVSADDLISAYRQIIAEAHEHGLRVTGGTITPFEGSFYYTPQGEDIRQVINHWIRTSGEFDSVIDFDAVMRDPQHPTRLNPAYDHGDHLHPSDAGVQALAAAVELKPPRK